MAASSQKHSKKRKLNHRENDTWNRERIRKSVCEIEEKLPYICIRYPRSLERGDFLHQAKGLSGVAVWGRSTPENEVSKIFVKNAIFPKISKTLSKF